MQRVARCSRTGAAATTLRVPHSSRSHRAMVRATRHRVRPTAPTADPRVREAASGRVPLLLAPGFLRASGVAALLALVGELVLLPRLVWLDDAVWRAILFGRGCAWDVIVERATDVATVTMIALLVAVAAFAI